MRNKLEQEYINRDDKFWSIVETLGGAVFSASDRPATQCTGFACEIQRKLGRARVTIYGFSYDDNPTPGILDTGAMGHDFAVLDNRWIIDPWITDVTGGARGVFDMAAPEDQEAILRLYGNLTLWERALCPADGEITRFEQRGV